MKKFLITSLLLSFASLAQALPINSDLSLPIPDNGIVSPHGSLQLPLDHLYKFVNFIIQCKISNESNTPVGMAFNVVSPAWNQNGGYKLDGNNLNDNQVMVTSGIHDFQTPSVGFGGDDGNAISFINADDTYSVRISDCVAKYAPSH